MLLRIHQLIKGEHLHGERILAHLTLSVSWDRDLSQVDCQHLLYFVPVFDVALCLLDL